MKKGWQKPKLVVLTRGRVEESVLQICKAAGIDDASAIVNDTGCSIADYCTCENSWKNHGAYVRCVAHTSEDFVAAGLITDSDKDIIVSTAAKSDCGKKGKKNKKKK